MPLQTPEYEAAARQTLVFPDAPLLHGNPIFYISLLIGLPYLFLFVPLLQSCQLLHFFGLPPLSVFVLLLPVAPASTQHREAVTDGVTAPEGLTHFVVGLAKLEQHQAVYDPHN